MERNERKRNDPDQKFQDDLMVAVRDSKATGCSSMETLEHRDAVEHSRQMLHIYNIHKPHTHHTHTRAACPTHIGGNGQLEVRVREARQALACP